MTMDVLIRVPRFCKIPLLRPGRRVRRHRRALRVRPVESILVQLFAGRTLNAIQGDARFIKALRGREGQRVGPQRKGKGWHPIVWGGFQAPFLLPWRTDCSQVIELQRYRRPWLALWFKSARYKGQYACSGSRRPNADLAALRGAPVGPQPAPPTGVFARTQPQPPHVAPPACCTDRLQCRMRTRRVCLLAAQACGRCCWTTRGRRACCVITASRRRQQNTWPCSSRPSARRPVNLSSCLSPAPALARG